MRKFSFKVIAGFLAVRTANIIVSGGYAEVPDMIRFILMVLKKKR